MSGWPIEESPTDGDFIVGVRPEFLKLSENGAVEGEIYSAMPTWDSPRSC